MENSFEYKIGESNEFTFDAWQDVASQIAGDSTGVTHCGDRYYRTVDNLSYIYFIDSSVPTFTVDGT